jgi:hypothetical protein
MDSDKVYRYEKISAEDTIRLIVLQPSRDLEARVQCAVICITLDECDKDIVEHYVALSYVWGDATARRQIYVDGAKLDITASLDCALRHLRDPSRVLRVWADGVCINQADFGDRNQQVRMMSSIYSLARHTIIFFGPGSAESDTVLERLVSRQLRSDKRKPFIGSAENLLNGKLESLVEGYILNNPWFIRVWILQELALSADPWVQSGTIRVRWDTFCDLILSSTSPIWSPDSRKHLIAVNKARLNFRHREGMQERSFLPKRTVNQLKFWDLLRSRRGAGVSNPRDMIYAHLSLTDLDIQDTTPIRYDLSVVDVYTSLARDFVASTTDLSILKHVEDSALEECRNNLPSWVPDVSIISPLVSFPFYTTMSRQLLPIYFISFLRRNHVSSKAFRNREMLIC